MTKTLATVLFGAVIVAFAGCSGCDDDTPEDGASDTGDPGDVVDVHDTTGDTSSDDADIDGAAEAGDGESTDAEDGSDTAVVDTGSDDADADSLCGNGVIDGDEACDDGNTLTGDGCENDCTLTIDDGNQNISRIAPPANTEEGQLENDPAAKIFVESSEAALTDLLAHDEHVPRQITEYGRQTGIMVQGTRLNSYLIHSDPTGQPDQEQVLMQVGFAREILAIATSTDTLGRTDSHVGLSSVVYPDAPERGLEAPDSVVIGPDRKKLTLSLQGSTGVDQVRVFTRAPQTESSLVVFSGAQYGGVGSVVPGENESDGAVIADEREVTLSSEVSVDIAAPGVYNNTGLASGGTIAGGVEVASRIVHFDPVGSSSVEDDWSAITVSESQQVIGLIVEDETLDQTDSIFGSPQITYPSASSTDTRGLELDRDDVVFGADNRSVWIHTQAQAGVDQVRILTEDK